MFDEAKRKWGAENENTTNKQQFKLSKEASAALKEESQIIYSHLETSTKDPIISFKTNRIWIQDIKKNVLNLKSN